MKLLTHINDMLREHYAPKRVEDVPPLLIAKLREQGIPKNVEDVPEALAEELRQQGTDEEAGRQAAAQRDAFLELRDEPRRKAPLVVAIVGVVAFFALYFSPFIFKDGELGDATSLLFLFLSVSIGGGLVISGYMEEKYRWWARGGAFIVTVAAGMWLYLSNTLTLLTVAIGLGGVALTILLDLGTPRSKAVKKEKKAKTQPI